MITVDARACGVGKTHGPNGMLTEIKKCYELGQNSVVVLPSIKIFDAYVKNIQQYIDCPDDLQVIHSGIIDGTVQELFNALYNKHRIIIITQQTFLRNLWHSGVKRDWCLFIDEAFDPFNKIDLWEKRHSNIKIDWDAVLDVQDLGANFVRLNIDSDKLLQTSFTRDNKDLKDLSDPNWTNYTHHKNIEALFDDVDRSIPVIQQLNPEIMTDWRSVRIAAAAFEITFQAEWMRSNNIEFDIIHKFKKHGKLIRLHAPIDEISNKEVKFSLHKAKQLDNWVTVAFRKYIETLQIKDKVLVLRNSANANGKLYIDETSVGFNAHGQNDYINYNKVSLEAATNLSPEQLAFHREFNNKDFDPFLARTGYDFYQIAMRTCMRKPKPEPADVYVLDARLAVAFDYFFDTGKRLEAFNWYPAQHPVKPKKALSNAEKQKAYRQRKKRKSMEIEAK